MSWFSRFRLWRRSSRSQRLENPLTPLHNGDLCDTCQYIMNKTLPDEFWSWSHDMDDDCLSSKIVLLESVNNIEDSAHKGCQLCLMFLSKLDAEEISEMRELLSLNTFNPRNQNPKKPFYSVIYSLRHSKTRSRLSIRAEFKIQNVNPRATRIVTKLMESLLFIPQADIAQLQGPEFLDKSTESTMTWDFVENCLRHCNEEHLMCAKTESTVLPSRLLQIGPQSIPTLRLCQTSTLSTRPKYVTLSHCWGDGIPFKLLRGNLSSLAEQIPWLELSKTFQDAIIIAQRLGVSFIWIDSLCIIQDSPEDWKKEATSMSHVYAGSYCNIAATGAGNGSEGCFTERDPAILKPYQFETRWQKEPKRYSCVNRRMWQDGVSYAPLIKRAWVFQERLLSSRIIHFSKTQVFWECRVISACEVYPKGFPFEVLDTINPRPLLPSSTDDPEDRTNIQPNQGPVTSAYFTWAEMVSSFSRGALSQEGDKLTAISGVAERLSRSISQKYLAGLWNDHLPYQLLWRVIFDSRGSRPSKYRAPSWSWASVDGPVAHVFSMPSDDPKDLLIGIKEARVELEGPNEFGQVKGGKIVLSGNLARGRLGQWSKEYSRNELIQWGLFFDNGHASMKRTHCNIDLDVRPSLAESGMYLFVLPVHRFTIGDENKTSTHVRGLLLQRQLDSDNQIFQRIGRFNSTTESDYSLLIRACSLFNDENPNRISENVGSLQGGDGMEGLNDIDQVSQRTITLI